MPTTTVSAGNKTPLIKSQTWAEKLAPFMRADDTRAIFEIALTAGLFVLAWVAIWALLQVGSWLASLAAVLAIFPAGGLMVRLFIIQHDCGHQSMFSSRLVNKWVGRIVGTVTVTPYEYWRFLHASHHASSGNLDRRGMGDIDTLTVREFLGLTKFGRFKYKLYRHPLVMFGLGPTYMFLVRHRLPVGLMKQRKHWISTQMTNLGILAISAPVIYLVGLKTFLLIQVPIVIVGASIGVWLFYVQHQFDKTQWDEAGNWKHEDAALHGSSYYDLPGPLMWLTGYIGIHHVHHLASRIPFHKLPRVLKAYPELKETCRLGFIESFKCVRLTLWDEEARRLIPFTGVKDRLTLAAAA